MLVDGVAVDILSCPAVVGAGLDIGTDDDGITFELQARRYSKPGNRRKKFLDFSGVFYRPDDDGGDPRNYLQTSVIEVSAESDVAKMVELVLRDQELVGTVGRLLLAGARECDCPFAPQCPKLDEMQLLFAVEAALIGR